jgi:hypothetical protein
MLVALETELKEGNNFLKEKGLFSLNALTTYTTSVPMWKPMTGEPYAGKPPVRFGGRGG